MRMTSTRDLLADRLDIIDVAVRYATSVDTRDWTSLPALFTADAVWEYRSGDERHTGPADIVARVRAGIQPLDATQHVVTNHVVAVAGDEASHTCYYLAQHLRGGESFLAAGRYEDRLRRDRDAWRIASRLLISVWSQGNPAVFEK
jgi:3-phenylpropionate/cinnamic acid dioxygenase small subunit